MAQIIPAIENSLLNHSRKPIKDTPKDVINDTALQDITKKENEKDNEDTADKDNDKSTKVLKDLEERWRTIRSSLHLNIDIIKNNSKQSVVPSSCGDDNKRTSIYNNMLSIKNEVNRKLSTHNKTGDDYKITGWLTLFCINFSRFHFINLFVCPSFIPKRNLILD